MNKNNRRARRYHWHSPTVQSFGASPHSGIVGLENQRILNLTDGGADLLRTHMVDLTKENPKIVAEAVREAELPNRHDVRKEDINMNRLASVLDLAYNRDIEKFEDLVDLKGRRTAHLKGTRHGERSDSWRCYALR